MDDQPGAHISRILTLLKANIHLEPQGNNDRIVRRVFVPIIADPTLVSVNWMNAEIASTNLRDSMPNHLRDDIDIRLAAAIDKQTSSAELTDALRATRALLNLDKGEMTKDDGAS